VFGGAEEDRTPDLCIANAALSQLSYRPNILDAAFWPLENTIIVQRPKAPSGIWPDLGQYGDKRVAIVDDSVVTGKPGIPVPRRGRSHPSSSGLADYSRVVGRANTGKQLSMRNFMKSAAARQVQGNGSWEGIFRPSAAVTGALVAAILLAAYFFSFTWRADPPLLDGDDAVYVLMADFFSPFSERDREILGLVMRRSYFPPLYPMLLGMVGGIASNTLLAHAVTVTILFLAFMALLVWANSISERPIAVTLLVILVATLPATVFQLFGLLSEGLYLALTLVALYFANRAPDARCWQYLAAVAIGLAILSRTVGFALWLAYAIWLASGKREGWKTLPLIALLPWFAWSAWKWSYGYTSSYAGNVQNLLSDQTLWAVVTEQLSTAPLQIWRGWIISISHLETPLATIGGTVLGAICVAGLARRLWQGRLDGFYVAIYLAMLLIWPYSYEARRLLFVVLPILLVQGLAIVDWIGFRAAKWPSLGRQAGSVYLGIIGIAALPAVVSIQGRLIAGLQEPNRPYAIAASWYTYANVDDAKKRLTEQSVLARGWRELGSRISAEECVYHIKSVAFMLYADRRAYATPHARGESEFWEKATLCRDFYLGAFVYPPYREPFYPRRFLGPGARVLSIDYVQEGGRQRPLGMLVRVDDPSHIK
jgi:hypothetical protein